MTDESKVHRKPRDVSVTFHDKPDSSTLKGFTEADVGRFLATLPRTKYEYGVEALNALDTWVEKKEARKRKDGELRMKAKAVQETEGLTSDGDRKAWVANHEEMKMALDEERQAEIDYKLADLKYTYLDDLFIAVRKASNRYEKMEADQARHEKYRQPDNDVPPPSPQE